MAAIPHGYILDDANDHNIVPILGTEKQKQVPIRLPSNGNVPDGFYKLDDTSMARLPPGMLPNVSAIDATGKFTYVNGYVTESQYYEKQYPSTKSTPPAGCYNVDSTHFSILPYGKIADTKANTGYIDDPALTHSDNVTYENKNLDVTYHPDPSTIRDDMIDSEAQLEGTAVFDPITKSYTLLPRIAVQSDLFYAEPGKYGRGNFVPNYTSAVQLSASTQLSTAQPYDPPADKKGFCSAYADLPDIKNVMCKSMNSFACASTDCCVLIGGEKCVSGDEKGPANAVEYSDKNLKNRDFYYYRSQCYGKCPPTSAS
jgi:hypothetical protein